MQKFKIGIIGAGSIVETNHLPAIGAIPNATVQWIFDSNTARSQRVSKMYKIPVMQDQSVEKALEQVDICLLAIPYGVRRTYIDLCKNQAKALLVEKPFAFSKSEHEGYCRGFAPWQIAVNFQRRFYHSVSVLQKIIREQVFGQLHSIHIIQGNFTLKGGSGYLSNKSLAGGGVIAESAVHLLDILLLITRATQLKVTSLRSLHREGLDYDTVFETDLVTLSENVSVYGEISTLRNLENGIHFKFENALVSCDLSPNGNILIRENEKLRVNFLLKDEPEFSELSSQATKINESFFIFWSQFLSGIENKRENLSSAFTSELTSAWLEAIYQKMDLS